MLSKLILSPKYKALKQKINYQFHKPPTYLNSGTLADVYDLHDGRILKITEDYTDALASITIKDNPSPFVVDIYDVFSYELDNDIYFCILAKKLAELPKGWRIFLDACVSIAGHGCLIKTYNRMKKLLTKAEARRFKKKMDWLEGLAKDFESRGLSWHDFHSGNFMNTDENNIQVIDLGCCNSDASLISSIPKL